MAKVARVAAGGPESTSSAIATSASSLSSSFDIVGTCMVGVARPRGTQFARSSHSDPPRRRLVSASSIANARSHGEPSYRPNSPSGPTRADALRPWHAWRRRSRQRCSHSRSALRNARVRPSSVNALRCSSSAVPSAATHGRARASARATLHSCPSHASTSVPRGDGSAASGLTWVSVSRMRHSCSAAAATPAHRLRGNGTLWRPHPGLRPRRAPSGRTWASARGIRRTC